MKTTATSTPRSPRAFRRDLVIALALLVGLSLLLMACPEITDVRQPSSAQQGEVIDVTVIIEGIGNEPAGRRPDARFFAPAADVDEDPATGCSLGAALGCSWAPLTPSTPLRAGSVPLPRGARGRRVRG